MYFISHRGNTLGPDISKENSVDYINDAIKKGYDVEIDVWFEKENFYLGHDKPTYLVDDKYLLISPPRPIDVSIIDNESLKSKDKISVIKRFLI